MTRIVIEAGSHGVVTTVSEMRKRLAKILSPLRGDQEVFFSFSAHIEKYRHELPPVACGAFLGAQGPCALQDGHAGDHVPDHSGLTPPAKYSTFVVGANDFEISRPSVVLGELARPEND